MNTESAMPMMSTVQQQFENARPLLTIAIPTYKRAPFLKELLTALLGQLEREPRVELIISDNASPDETPHVVASFVNLGLRVRYLRNDINIGPDANFKQCFEEARGKYVWIVGDDDIVVPGGLAKILTFLTTGDYALSYLTPYWFRHDYLAERTSDRLGRVARISDGLQFVREAGAMIGFLSSMIVNKDIYCTIPHRPLSAYDGTNLMQLGWVCPLLASKSKYLIVWERLVAGRVDNTSGWGICQVFGVNFKRIVETALKDREDLADALVASTLKYWLPGTIMQVRLGKGTGVAEDMRSILEPIYKTNWRYWAYVYPLVTMPLYLANLWYSVILLSKRFGSLLSAIRTLSRTLLARTVQDNY